jgi:hypothetical protein
MVRAERRAASGGGRGQPRIGATTMKLLGRMMRAYTIAMAALPIVRRLGREVVTRTGKGADNAPLRKALGMPPVPPARHRRLRRSR